MLFHLVHLFELLKSSILATSASNTKIYLFRINANNTEIYLVKFQTSTIATNLISLPRRNKSSVLCNFRIFLYAFTQMDSLEGLLLKLQYCGHLMQRANSPEMTVILGKIEGKRKKWQRMRWLDSITNSTDMEGQRSLECCSPWGCKVGLNNNRFIHKWIKCYIIQNNCVSV